MLAMATEQTKNPPRKQLPVRLDPELMERVRNCVFWTPGATLCSVVEAALVAYLDKVEKKHGSAFPIRTSALRRGKGV